jgi:hypothetical protein
MPDKGLYVDIQIVSPQDREEVRAPVIQVAGLVSARFFDGTSYHDVFHGVENVKVSVGDSSTVVPIAPGETRWTYEGRVMTFGPLSITAEATAQFVYGNDTYTKSAGVGIVASVIPEAAPDTTPPTLTVDCPDTVAGPENTFTTTIRGTAEDLSGVESVTYGVDEEPTKPAKSEMGDWRRWSAKVDLSGEGDYKIRVRATDTQKNQTEKTVTVSACRPGHNYPVFLLPIRLETRFSKDADGNVEDLWVRIYPDDIFVTSHEPMLAESEFEAGERFWKQKERRSAWRELARRFGPQRAAWIRQESSPERIERIGTPALRSDDEARLTFPRLIGQTDPAEVVHVLPDRFVVFLYQNDTVVWRGETEKIIRNVALFNPTEEQLFEAWMVDKEKAEEYGMAVRISKSDVDLDKGFSRIVVVGLKSTTPEYGEKLLEQLIDSHHYGAGLAFLPYGTPTNNTLSGRSGYSDTLEDHEGSYEIEVSGPQRHGPGGDGIQTNAELLEHALGLSKENAVFQHIDGSADAANPCAKEMREAVWGKTGNHLLQNLLQNIVSEEDRRLAAIHFSEHVCGSGPLPAIRVGDQPYGILPVTQVKQNWHASKLDNNGDESGVDFDQQLHAALTKMCDRWLSWAGNTDRVPHVRGSGDPDEELLKILAMEPVSIGYRVRPFVDERLVPIVLKDLYDAADEESRGWYRDMIKLWAKKSGGRRYSRAADWSGLTEVPVAKLSAADLLHLISWRDDQDLLESLVDDFKDLANATEFVASSCTQDPPPDLLDRLLRETLDLLTHRLDAWITSLAKKRLNAMRQEDQHPTGIYLGAYGWVENLEPFDAPSQGYVYTPSYDQAVAAAVVHNAYLTHEEVYPNDQANPYRINLNSERVRRALAIQEGIGQGQSLGALLGYQFERALHERRLDRHIDEFRAAFPLVSTKETALPPEANGDVKDLAARNVVDGLALARWWEDPDRLDIPTGQPEIREKLKMCLKLSENCEDEHFASDAPDLRTEVRHLQNTLDAFSDLLLYEAVYQAARGNYERSGAATDAAPGKGGAAELQSIRTPPSGRAAGQRVCLLLPPPANSVEGPRATAEPRLAAWFGDLLGDWDRIGCRCWFPSDDETGGEPGKISINEATVETLVSLPQVSIALAQAIVTSRELEGIFWEVDDLATRIPGFTSETVNAIRSQVTTGVKTLSLKALIGPDPDRKPRFGPADLLYLSALPATGEAAEMQQRVAYHIREVYGEAYKLSYDVPVAINFSRPPQQSKRDGFVYGVEEALELGAQVLKAVGGGTYLQPGGVALPAQAEPVSFSDQDIDDMKQLVEAARDQPDEDGEPGLSQLYNKIEPWVVENAGSPTPEDKIDALFRASRYGIPGLIPAGRDDPDLDKRLEAAFAEIHKRLIKSQSFKDEADKMGQPVPDEDFVDLVTRRINQVKRYIDAMKALFGEDFVVLPTFTPPEPDNLKQAFAQDSLLAGRGEERVRLWLQQAARTCPGTNELEQVLAMHEAWRGALIAPEDSPLTLRVAQLPFSPENRWVGLDDDERGEKYDISRDRGALSIVAAFGAPAQTPVLVPGEQTHPGTKLAGILLDQWNEFIPADTATTGLSFQYNAPSSEAPQCLLLAVPGQREAGTAETWTEDELAEIVTDTLDLAKVRAVDLDAMSELHDDSTYTPDVGSALPALLFLAVDQKKYFRDVEGEEVTRVYDETIVEERITSWIESLKGG